MSFVGFSPPILYGVCMNNMCGKPENTFHISRFFQVNIQLYSANEKAVLKGMVSTMIAYNLTYSQHKNNEGSYSYSLEP